MLQLRPYQQEAINAVYAHLRARQDNPCVVIPTAGGKTPVIASICKDIVGRYGRRALILTHVKELIEQSADKLRLICPEVSFGIYSASLKRRDTQSPVIVAGIQSVHGRACELGAFDLVIVDEAHLIPPDGQGMYQRFLADARVVNPRLRVVGFTATPFRLKTGSICTPTGVLNHVCYEVSVRRLIDDGFLCPLITKIGIDRPDTDQLHVVGGEYVTAEVESLMDQLVGSACREIVDYTTDRNAALIFASGVRHGQTIVDTFRQVYGVECGMVTGETTVRSRESILKQFQDQQLKYLCNVNVLTTGFDAPHIDCVALVRPTMSQGLYYQMVGRGFRLHPSKTNCLILDFGGNVERHGPVDQVGGLERSQRKGVAPTKECPRCHSIIAASFLNCPDCGLEFEPPERAKHAPTASSASVLSGSDTSSVLEVASVQYHLHTKRIGDGDVSRTMRVDYDVSPQGRYSEWVCFEHTGYAGRKAANWWSRRSHEPVPTTVEKAIEIAHAGGLATPKAIKVRQTDSYPQVTDYQLGPIPELIGSANN